MKVLTVLSAILVVSCAQDIIEDFKLNWPHVHENERNPLEPRIAGGAPAVPHEFPYQIALYMQHKQEEGQLAKKFSLCGASLISDKVVLTAAHCLIKSEIGMVFVGSHKFLGDKKDERKLVGVTKFDWVIHPQYDRLHSKNDIAIIKLPKAVELNDKVKIINLPSRNQKYSDIEGRLATASGWGRVGDEKPIADALRFAHLKIMSPATCRAYYSVLFTETNICADGSHKKSVCSGDSGGPLAITETDGTKTIIGLTSYGNRRGCEKGYPTVFTRVSSYVDWISKETGIKLKN